MPRGRRRQTCRSKAPGTRRSKPAWRARSTMRSSAPQRQISRLFESWPKSRSTSSASGSAWSWTQKARRPSSPRARFTTCSRSARGLPTGLCSMPRAKARLEERYQAWSAQGIRVLAVASRTVEPQPPYSRELERDLTLRRLPHVLRPAEGGRGRRHSQPGRARRVHQDHHGRLQARHTTRRRPCRFAGRSRAHRD